MRIRWIMAGPAMLALAAGLLAGRPGLPGQPASR